MEIKRIRRQRLARANKCTLNDRLLLSPISIQKLTTIYCKASIICCTKLDPEFANFLMVMRRAVAAEGIFTDLVVKQHSKASAKRAEFR